MDCLGRMCEEAVKFTAPDEGPQVHDLRYLWTPGRSSMRLLHQEQLHKSAACHCGGRSGEGSMVVVLSG